VDNGVTADMLKEEWWC